jgi:hypothetical protein
VQENTINFTANDIILYNAGASLFSYLALCKKDLKKERHLAAIDFIIKARTDKNPLHQIGFGIKRKYNLAKSHPPKTPKSVPLGI